MIAFQLHVSVSKDWFALRSLGIILLLGTCLLGCHDLAGTQALPSGTQDPSYYNNATGALGMRNAAIFAFGTELPDYIIATGLLTDEMTDLSTLTVSTGTSIQNGSTIVNPLDERILPELAYGSVGSYASDKTYDQLQGARTALLQAMGQLAAYDTSGKDTAILAPAVGKVFRGELYALYGYTEIMLADLFCSGIPLSTLDFQHDYTYRAGSARDDVYQDAITKLDTAFILTADSMRIQNLARIGLGRAYLDLNNTKAAADDVSLVPDDYQYQLSESWRGNGAGCFIDPTCNVINSNATLSDSEGGNGVPYLSDGDPRTADTTFDSFQSGEITYAHVSYPRLYLALLQGSGYAPITIASGVEARLIEAEAALRGEDPTSWLNKLNRLRETAPILGTAESVPSKLPDLNDPGTDSARVAVTFHERASWLYLTGHRQGDLRRQLRQYAYWRNQAHVYPSGTYLGLGAGIYGSDVTAPIPAGEYVNPLFHGCIDRAP